MTGREFFHERDEPEEILQEIGKIRVSQCSLKIQPTVGDVVRWVYEWRGDPLYGSLYIVVGFQTECNDIAVVRVLNDLSKIREFHLSQLEKVNGQIMS